jgi:hypothetical protein
MYTLCIVYYAIFVVYYELHTENEYIVCFQWFIDLEWIESLLRGHLSNKAKCDLLIQVWLYINKLEHYASSMLISLVVKHIKINDGNGTQSYDSAHV